MKKIDFFGKQPNINFLGGSETIKTLFGSILSSFTLILTAILLFFGLTKLYSSVYNYTSLNSQLIPYDPELVKFSFKDAFLLPSFVAIDDSFNSSLEKINSLYTIVYYQKRYQMDFESGELKLISKESFTTTTCTQFVEEMKKNNIGVYSKLSQYLFELYGVCPTNFVDTDWQVFGTRTSSSYQIVEVKIYPCSLETGCYLNVSPKTYNNLGTAVSIDFQDFKNKESPIKQQLKDDLLFFNPLITTRQTLKLSRGQIVDKLIELPGYESTRTHNFTVIDDIQLGYTERNSKLVYCSKQSVEDESCDPYFIYRFEGSHQKLIYYRSYLQLWDIFSEIGGLIELVFLSSGFIVYTYSLIFTKYHLRKKLQNQNLNFKFSSSIYVEKDLFKEFQEFRQIKKYVDSRNYLRIESGIFLKPEHLILIPLLTMIEKYYFLDDKDKSEKELGKKKKFKFSSKKERVSKRSWKVNITTKDLKIFRKKKASRF